MDDFSDQISKILNDPQAMEQIRSMAGMLGGNSAQNSTAAAPSSPVPIQNRNQGVNNMMSPEILSAVSQFMPLLSEYKKEDDGTRLLNALRPFLSNERRQKLDEATKMLQMMRFLPLIKKLGKSR